MTDNKPRPTRLTKNQIKFIHLIKEYGLAEAMIMMEWDLVQVYEERDRSPIFNKKYLDAVGITDTQEQFLTLYLTKAGNISEICKSIGVVRQTYYAWRRNSPTFAQMADDIHESLIDFAESQLMKNIQEGKEQSLFYFLNVKGKARGYGKDTQVVVNNTNNPVTNNYAKDMSMEDIDNRIAELEGKLNSSNTENDD